MQCLKWAGTQHFYILAFTYTRVPALFCAYNGTTDMFPVLRVKSSGSGWLGYMIPYMIRNDIETT